MQKYLAAAIQLNSTADLEANLALAGDWIARAAGEGATLIVLPENYSFLGSEPEKVSRAAEIAERSEQFLREEAARHHLDLVGGGHAVPAENGKTLNRLLWVNGEGNIRAQYDKIHLFDAELPGQTLRESDSVVPGESPTVVTDDIFGTVGLSICYDLRFPELYRLHADEGAEVLLVPAAFTAFTGQTHWEVLLRARAIENGCYVVAPAQCGRHFGDRRSHGHAMIIDPWGNILADAGDEPGMAIAKLSPARLAEVRSILPSLHHRRL